jgi:N4-gp56 family major capsid protein
MANKVNIAGTTSGDNVKLDNAVLDVYAQEIMWSAQPILRFESVATIRTDLSVNPGETIRFLKYNSLTGKSAIAETSKIETDVLSTSTLTITVSEHAKAVAVSEKLLRIAITDVMADAATALGQHYAKNRDALCRDALLANTNVLYAKAKADRASLIATDTFDVDLIRSAVETLATNKAPKFNLDAYVCFVHPHQGRSLRSDAAWINVQNYATPQNMLSGEIGRIEDVRFIETTHVPYVKKATQDIWADSEDTTDNTVVAANTATDVYRAVIVGQNAYGLAVALPVELRDDGIRDFGREHALAYYGIWGAGLIETGHSLVLETA